MAHGHLTERLGNIHNNPSLKLLPPISILFDSTSTYRSIADCNHIWYRGLVGLFSKENGGPAHCSGEEGPRLLWVIPLVLKPLHPCSSLQAIGEKQPFREVCHPKECATNDFLSMPTHCCSPFGGENFTNSLFMGRL